jgi:hypothetical protein
VVGCGVTEPPLLELVFPLLLPLKEPLLLPVPMILPASWVPGVELFELH